MLELKDTRYSLKITPAAREDLDEIYEYISDCLFNPRAAADVIGEIETSLLSLRNFPFRCESSQNEILRLRGYRKLTVQNYVALYIVEQVSKSVIVMRIFHGSMDYEKCL